MTSKPVKKYTLHITDGYFVEGVALESKHTVSVVDLSSYEALQQEKEMLRLDKEHLELIKKDYFETIQRLKAEVDSWKKTHVITQEAANKEIASLKEKLEDAVETIVKMQNNLKLWMSPHNLMGQEITESYNLGAKFLSKNLNKFNAYLEKHGVKSDENK